MVALLFELFGRRHTLLEQRLDGHGLFPLAVVSSARLRHLQPEFVQVVLHGTGVRLRSLAWGSQRTRASTPAWTAWSVFTPKKLRIKVNIDPSCG